MIQPLLCRSEAFEWFSQQLPVIGSTAGLLHAALAISMHAFDDFDPREVDNSLHVLAQRIKSRVRSNNPTALLAHLHQVLFKEEGYLGNWDSYFNPSNGYLPTVMGTKRGNPETLSLLYKVVAERAGLCVEGINSPGHFLIRVRCNGLWMLVDPFFGGVELSQAEAFTRIRFACRYPVSRTSRLFQKASHQQWIARKLTFQQQFFTAYNCQEDLAAMNELQALLRHSAW